MDVTEMNRFFAVLALGADVGVVVLVVGLLAGPRLALLDELAWWTRDRALTLAAVVAAVSTLGSLYYSEIAHFVPCRLCWFQRIGMYPLVVVLGIAARRRDLGARAAAVVLALGGLSVSVWHRVVQQWPTLESDSCSALVRCSIPYVKEWGLVTIPWMAGSGFALIVAILTTTWVLTDTGSTPTAGSSPEDAVPTPQDPTEEVAP